MSETSPFRSRKFILALLVFLVASLFRCFDLLDSADWKQLAVAMLAIYGAANVAQKSVDNKKPEPV